MISYSTSWWSLLLIHRPREDERLSWPCWLTYSGRLAHINGYPSAAGPVQTSESSPIRDRRSTTEPPNPNWYRRRCPDPNATIQKKWDCGNTEVYILFKTTLKRNSHYRKSYSYWLISKATLYMLVKLHVHGAYCFFLNFSRDLRIGNFRSNRITNRIGGYDSNSNLISNRLRSRLRVQCRLPQ